MLSSMVLGVLGPVERLLEEVCWQAPVAVRLSERPRG